MIVILIVKHTLGNEAKEESEREKLENGIHLRFEKVTLYGFVQKESVVCRLFIKSSGNEVKEINIYYVTLKE